MNLYYLLGAYIALHVLGTVAYISSLYLMEELSFKDTLIAIFWPIYTPAVGVLYMLGEIRKHIKTEQGELNGKEL